MPLQSKESFDAIEIVDQNNRIDVINTSRRRGRINLVLVDVLRLQVVLLCFILRLYLLRHPLIMFLPSSDLFHDQLLMTLLLLLV